MKTNLLLLAISTSALLAACTALTPGVTTTPSITETPLLTVTPSRTPWPTTDKTATVEAQETKEAKFIEEYVLPVLELAGYSQEGGSLAYRFDTPKNITAREYDRRYWEPMRTLFGPVLKNFILSIDIKWDSKSGIAGCDIIFRAETDFSQGEQAYFRTQRLSGFPYWQLQIRNHNKRQGIINDGTNKAIDLDPGSVNHYVLVADGAEVITYANGILLGSGLIKESMTEGVIGFQAWQESGETTCTFSNAWVWELP